MRRNYLAGILSLFALILIVGGAAHAQQQPPTSAQLQFRKAVDFDGDGKADITAIRRDSGAASAVWWIRNSGNGSATAVQWGSTQDYTMATGDYDGDGKADLAVIRDEGGAYSWYIRRSSTGILYGYKFGRSVYTSDANADIITPADYDGDGKTDIGVVRMIGFNNFPQGISAIIWYYISSQTGQLVYKTVTPSIPNVESADCAVLNGDFDGDGKADFAHKCGNYLYNQPTTWKILLSQTGTIKQLQWGLGQDQSAAGDYDGDGKTDIAIMRPANPNQGGNNVWWILRSSDQAVQTTTFGYANPNGGATGLGTVDTPAQADYDGDGKADIAIERIDRDPATTYRAQYWIRQSSDGAIKVVNWGYSIDSGMTTGWNPALQHFYGY